MIDLVLVHRRNGARGLSGREAAVVAMPAVGSDEFVPAAHRKGVVAIALFDAKARPLRRSTATRRLVPPARRSGNEQGDKFRGVFARYAQPFDSELEAGPSSRRQRPDGS